MHRLARVLTIAGPIALVASVAYADLVISTDATQNVTCSAGVCTATAKNAVLNVNDLTGILGSGNAEVTTGGGATDLVVKAAFGWTAPTRLTLSASRLVEFDRPVKVEGNGAVAIRHGRELGEDMRFPGRGRIDFASAKGRLTINGEKYKLVGDIATLAMDVTANPSGNFALANSYDAKKDGSYATTPVLTEFDGKFEGLGHVIRNLTINVSTNTTSYIGLFSRLHPDGLLRDIGLENLQISIPSSSIDSYSVGALVAETGDDQRGGGAIVNASTSGSISVGQLEYAAAGGLVGYNLAITSIVNSHSDCSVSVNTGGSYAGGLAAYNQGIIAGSYATGQVTGGDAGGLVGFAYGYEGSGISNSYATGAAYGSDYTGGLVGDDHNGAVAKASYSIGSVSGGIAGGFTGNADVAGYFKHDYWDESSSGTNLGCGAGYCYGVTGLTGKQLKSALPHGFDPKIWGQNSTINNGYPYLLANPPPK